VAVVVVVVAAVVVSFSRETSVLYSLLSQLFIFTLQAYLYTRITMHCLDQKHHQSNNRMWNKSLNNKIYKNSVRIHIMYAYVTVKPIHTTASFFKHKQYVNREKEWVYKYSQHVFTSDFSHHQTHERVQ
jgi:hypothetical protein